MIPDIRVGDFPLSARGHGMPRYPEMPDIMIGSQNEARYWVS